VKKYYVYMLRCFDGSFYVGVTNDVMRRFWEHCNSDNPASYTYSRRPLLLVYADEFQRVEDAIAAEKKLKNWTHHKKRAISERDWPLLRRLAARR
jgi:putative endonuclease